MHQLGSLLRPLFYFLCLILLIHRVRFLHIPSDYESFSTGKGIALSLGTIKSKAATNQE